MSDVYQGFDINEYQHRLDHALYRYGLPAGARRGWARDLNENVWDMLGYMQPMACLYWQKYIHHSLMQSDAVDREDVYALTLLDHRWHFGEWHWNFQPGKIVHQVRRALQGLNYIVMIEFELFGNVDHFTKLPSKRIAADHRNDGRVIAPHVQGLMWGKGPSRRQRTLLAGGVFNAPGVVLRPLTDFSGAVRYMVKPPYKGHVVRPQGPRRYVRYPWEVPLKTHHLLFSNLFNYSYPDLAFAGGEGRAVLAKAKRLWRDGYVPANLRPVVYPQRPFHTMPLVRRPEHRWSR